MRSKLENYVGGGWPSGKYIAHINELIIRPARLVLRWMTASTPARYETSHSDQLSLIPSAGWQIQKAMGVFLVSEGNGRFAVSPAMRH